MYAMGLWDSHPERKLGKMINTFAKQQSKFLHHNFREIGRSAYHNEKSIASVVNPDIWVVATVGRLTPIRWPVTAAPGPVMCS